MNWKECIRSENEIFGTSRFSWPFREDFNCIDGTTISDIWGGFLWVLTYPGDWLLEQISDTAAGRFLEMSPNTYLGHPLSVVIGSFILMTVLAVAAYALDG